MPVAKLRVCSTPDAMKSEKKSGKPEEGSDSLDNIIRQVIGKEPFFSFSRAGDSPVQWIQLLHALDQQDLPGWPFLSPSKVQMQKCEKCSREFCSPINYRRHIRVHRRSLNIDKDSAKNRDFLGAFWDKLCLDEAKEIVSFKNVTLEEVHGSSIIRALTAFICKPGFSSLPQVYVKAGASLLDIVQARPSRFPLSSGELFSILDNASEKTFLCAGTAVSLQKFVFDGEAGKIGLEMKNLVACTSFLVEQKLVEAWLADKDAEALRCHKLLVEEEEAAQKRQAELLERRRLKKLKQKEQKAKEQTDWEKADFKDRIPDTVEGVSSSAETSSLLAASDSDSHTLDSPTDPVIQLLNTEVETDTREMTYAGSAYCQNVDHQLLQGSGQRQLIIARRQLPKPQRGALNGFHVGQIHPIPKLGVMPKHGMYRDKKPASLANGHKVWTRKTKFESEEGSDIIIKESKPQPDQNENCEVLIGSISVVLGDRKGQRHGDILAAAVDLYATDHPPLRNNVQEKSIKPDSGQSGTNRSMMKLWRPVGTHETGCSALRQNDKREAEVDVITGKGMDRTLSNESCVACGAMDDNSYENRNDSPTLFEESPDSGGLRLFSCHAAEAFLAQRWKEAIAADHVKLVLSLESEHPGCPEKIQNDAQVAAPLPLDCCKRSILGNAENRLANVGFLEHSTTVASKAKFRAKPEKVSTLKYIPKQRNIT